MADGTYEVGENGEVIISSGSPLLLGNSMEIELKSSSISSNAITSISANSSNNQESEISKKCFSVKIMFFAYVFCNKKIEEYRIY